MLILMKHDHEPAHIDGVVAKIKGLGLKPHVIEGENVAIGITGNHTALDPELFSPLPGVANAIPVTKPYKLAGRDFAPRATEIKVRNAVFGPDKLVVIAGPCAVESEEQMLRIAHKVKAAGATVLRGGAYKPRTSPYAFQGLGIPGLQILKKAREETGLPVVTEALDLQSLQAVCDYADIIQIGARNMQNFTLLQEVGRTRLPVLLKRGLSATIDEWLMAAEYIMAHGNNQIILCERGMRSFDPHTRNLMDISAVPVIHQLSHLPICVDPSHGVGRRTMVAPMGLAACAAGANAVMVDVHDQPEMALCDGPQALLPKEFEVFVRKIKAVSNALGTTVCSN